MQLTHAPEFRIHLEDDHIILHGKPEESAGVVLRGSVILNCHELTKVKSVYLEFLGMTNVNWCEGNNCLIFCNSIFLLTYILNF